MNRSAMRRYFSRIQPHLVPVAAPSLSICCESCRSGVRQGESRCDQCHKFRVPNVLPISMSVHGHPLHSRLGSYKGRFKYVPHELQREFSLDLAALLGLFLQRHLSCLGGDFDYVVTVPSRQQDAVKSIIRLLPLESRRHLVALKAVGTKRNRRYQLVDKQVNRRRVLLLD